MAAVDVMEILKKVSAKQLTPEQAGELIKARGRAKIETGFKRFSIVAFEEEKLETGWFTVDVKLIPDTPDVNALKKLAPNIITLLKERREELETEEAEKPKKKKEEEEEEEEEEKEEETDEEEE